VEEGSGGESQGRPAAAAAGLILDGFGAAAFAAGFACRGSAAATAWETELTAEWAAASAAGKVGPATERAAATAGRQTGSAAEWAAATACSTERRDAGGPHEDATVEVEEGPGRKSSWQRRATATIACETCQAS
jgi:hypothetical protein